MNTETNKPLDWNDWFYYDESSPTCLRWKVEVRSGRNNNQCHVAKDSVAGSLGSSNYYQVKLDKTLHLCHRVISEIFGNKLSGTDFVDHKDGNKLNNTVGNLRIVSKSLNARNYPKRKDNSSGVVGVSKISNGQGAYYWSARCEGLDGSIVQKRFPINKFGDSEAFRLACEFRKLQIEILNAAGAGYTERHGE